VTSEFVTLSAMMQASKQTSSTSAKGALQLKEISIIPITAAPSASNAAKGNSHQHRAIVEKATSSNQSMTDDESADSLRKKRCTDRYDSSESSDR
jgi:hypothetical protein